MMLGPRHLTLLSRAAFVGLALFPSLGFLSFQYLQESGLVARDAHIQAHQINGVIARNPEGWQYKTHWLLNAAVVVRRENTYSVLYHGGEELLRIGDLQPFFKVSESAPIHDFGTPVGHVEVGVDMRDTAAISGILGAGGVLGGWLFLFMIQRRFIRPLEVAERVKIENQERLQDLVDLSSDWFWELDADLRFTLVSGIPAGRDSQSLIGRSYRSLDCEWTGEQWESHLADVVGRRTVTADCPVMVDGGLRWFLIRIKPRFDAQANAIGYRGVARDITERKQAEIAQADAKQAAEAASQARSSFLATMSHEIRTPINAVMGLSDLALSTTGLSPRTRDYLVKIDNASRSLLRIINDVLDFSKIEAGGLELENVDFYLRDVFDHLSDLFRATAAERGIELILSASVECRYLLVGDYLRLEQILMNLIGNALKFTEGGEVEIGVETLVQSEGSIQLEFSVRDTGIGLTPEQISRLFGAFVQADGSTTRKYGGTGLGLAICKRLTELMGGRIWVESQLGQGSTFRFTLPFERRAHEDGGGLTAPDDLFQTAVLLVDDNPATRKALSRMLMSFGFEVTEAASGAEALELVERPLAHPLALVDWHMPAMNGLEVARRIRETGSAPRIILMTDYHLEKEIERQAGPGDVNALLSKPINCSLLFDTIMEVFGKDVAKAYRVRRQDTDVSGILERIGGAQVLLVEDNAVNQQVAKEILEGIGLVVVVANHGAEAVQMVETADFDAVLMDVQMPVMDGYDATRQIRQQARFKDLPIIAMTANALLEDREKSLAAGMNDHVTKPIDKKHLYDVLQRWIPPGSRAAAVPSGPSAARESAPLPPLPGIDTAAALERLNGNRKLFRALLLGLKQDLADVAGTARQALSGPEEANSVLAPLHALKGAAGNLGAHDLFEAIRDLEQAVKSGDRDRWPGLLNRFEKNLAQVTASIASLETEEPPPRPEDPVSSERAPIDRETVMSLMDELSHSLVRGDISAEECLGRLRGRLGASAGHPLLARMSEQVDRFDFQGALTTLGDLASALDIPWGGAA